MGFKASCFKQVAVLHFASDAYEIDVQPVFKANLPAASLYFAALIVSGSFISLNFFVSFVVDGFYAAQGQVCTLVILQVHSFRNTELGSAG